MASPVRLLHTQHISFAYGLKKAKQRPDIEGQPVLWKIFRPGGVFFQKHGENTDASGSVTEGRNIGQNNIHSFECLISLACSQ